MSHPMHRESLSGIHHKHRGATSPFRPLAPSSVAATQLVLFTARAVGDDIERANEAFISAARLYEDGHWEFAFERIALLADHGHTPAAKLALLMLRYGRALYGTNFVARPGQVARWAQRVLRRSYTAAEQAPPQCGRLVVEVEPGVTDRWPRSTRTA